VCRNLKKTDGTGSCLFYIHDSAWSRQGLATANQKQINLDDIIMLPCNLLFFFLPTGTSSDFCKVLYRHNI
jgi:hypothetical protein